ncbi:cyclic pyranopterin monophosphate synthase [Kordiimonas sediminis]|uniref:GTP 3',8-cyclase n=1 Tax=Kordiimonas sediminis TaxID=1735581 RepID=A0A919ART3_9PROT|nr:GTP 3',8-cyclase MoaA [Kordiimonas sediminis]GHF22213.1 cyclic pyranopterin monophosphate synthase [Kordiimonas sediminis]
MGMLRDNYNRTFPYLRLSVTEVCNFRCSYCLPNGYKKQGMKSFLSLEEIERLIRAFAELGVKKVRLTGGEPTVRNDLADIISIIKNTVGIETVAMTTNGYKLPEFIDSYAAAGLDAINVSMDSMNKQKFHSLTGHDRLDDVLKGIRMARDLGIQKRKINAVLLKGVNDLELENYLSLIRSSDLSVRFIELMRTGDNQDYFNQYHLDPAAHIADLRQNGWQEVPREMTDGPARCFAHPDYQGSIGFIAPYSRDFCSTCNRLRVSATGGLQLCLFGADYFSLRKYLQDDQSLPDMQERVTSLLGIKPLAHELHQGNSGRTEQLAMIGG